MCKARRLGYTSQLYGREVGQPGLDLWADVKGRQTESQPTLRTVGSCGVLERQEQEATTA